MSKEVLHYGRSRGNFLSALFVISIFLASTLAAFGQVTTGSIQGVVKDPNGALVSGATVTVTNVDTNTSRDVTTNNEGFYRVTNLTPGQNYTVTVKSAGFADYVVTSISVRLGTEESVDVQLTVGGAAGTAPPQAVSSMARAKNAYQSIFRFIIFFSFGKPKAPNRNLF